MKNVFHRSTLGRPLMLLTFLFVFGINQANSQAKEAQIKELLSLYQEQGKFNGSALVSTDSKVFYKGAAGMANMEWDIPNAPNTKHRLGSITKQFTAMLILQLAEANKLDLHAPISAILPDYPKVVADKITVHHLLTHTSGIPNYTSFPGFFQNESRNPYTPTEFIDKFSEMELEFTPGKKFNYSNSGYFLLGVIIEKLSGKSYEDMLHEKIFTPADMNESGYDNHEDILANRATGYEKQGAGYVNSRYLDMSIPYAAGSLYSTVEDLYKWDQALYTDKLLGKQYMKLYFTKNPTEVGTDNYAYGWEVNVYPIGNTTDSIEIISHGGGINGFNTIITRCTTDQSLIVLLNNTGGAPLNEIASSLRAIMDSKTYDLPKMSLAMEMLSIIQDKGIEQGLSFFRTNKSSNDYDVREEEINQIGYQLMRNGNAKDASQILLLNTKEYPNSFNAFDSYAEALMTLGNNDEAITNYRKSVEMNPANQNGIDMLKKMGVDVSEYEKTLEISEDILQSYVGEYQLAPSFSIVVTRKGKQLFCQATGQSQFELFARSETEFYLKVVAAEVKFGKLTDGKAESMTLFQGGQEMLGMRVGE